MKRPVVTPQISDLGAERQAIVTNFHDTSKSNVFRHPLPKAVGSFLKYIAEDDQAYQVRTQSRQLIEVDKGRAPQEASSLSRPKPLKVAYRWLVLAALGLTFSGLGALVFAPIAGIAAWRAKNANLSKADESLARLIILLSGLLMVIGAGLALLFWLHVRG